MDIDWTLVLFLLLLADSLGAVLLAWFGRDFWISATGKYSKIFPPAKGWAALYLILVIFIGSLLGIY